MKYDQLTDPTVIVAQYTPRSERKVAMDLAACLYFLEGEARKAALPDLAAAIHDAALKATITASDA
ncbi:MAG: hypothetical protein AB7P52_07725 [Alphaproteobacteria bacterium]